MKKAAALLLVILMIPFGLTGRAGAERASSLREFAAALEAHTENLDTSFTISCQASLISKLEEASSVDEESTILGELLLAAGSTGAYRYSMGRDSVRIVEISYYAGWRILHLWKTGRTDLLSPREQRTLEAALALVSGAAGSDLEKERYIYDALCDRITYDKAEQAGSSGEKDCAIGALLNGRADCDGYSDALLLCCGLVGIPCRFMHGDSIRPSAPGSPEGKHMWNLVNIDGTWLMIDVTWGDHAQTSYLFFNLGLRDAADSYRWCEETLLTDVAMDADFAHHRMADQQPVTVSTMEEVYQAAREATSARRPRLTLFCPKEPLWRTDRETFDSMLSRGGFGSITYNETGRLFEVYNRSIPKDLMFCDTEEEILSAIEGCAEKNMDSFTLYLSPDLAGSVLNNGLKRLRELFSLTRMADPGMSLQYSMEGGSVSLSGVAYIAPLPSCATEEEALNLVRDAVRSRPSSLAFIWKGQGSASSLTDKIATVLYSSGASSCSWGMNGYRIRLTEIAYYDEFLLASSEEEVRSYLTRAARANQKTIRIYCAPALYQRLHADNSSRFFELLREAGFSVSGISYNDSYNLLLVE